MEDPHGKVWREVALFIVITPSNGWTNQSCEPEPFYTPPTIDQEKLEELGGGHPACRVRIQPCQALHDTKEQRRRPGTPRGLRRPGTREGAVVQVHGEGDVQARSAGEGILQERREGVVQDLGEGTVQGRADGKR